MNCRPGEIDMAAKVPQMLAHVVYRTRRLGEMLNWYKTVFGATVQHQDPALAFLTFDEEHHRIALVDLDVVKPAAGDAVEERRSLVGVDHVAYTIGTLEDLFENYAYFRDQGIMPYWCVHHGLTVSMYYADPDGNQMEFQVDAYPTKRECSEFMRGPINAANPVGVEYDPEEWLGRMRAGVPASELLRREVHEPMSPIRGALNDQ
jgi:catechol-2,3-dioxygenase